MQESINEFTKKLRRWNKEVFGDIRQRKERLRLRLGGVQAKLAQQTSLGSLALRRNYMAPEIQDIVTSIW